MTDPSSISLGEAMNLKKTLIAVVSLVGFGVVAVLIANRLNED